MWGGLARRPVHLTSPPFQRAFLWLADTWLMTRSLAAPILIAPALLAMLLAFASPLVLANDRPFEAARTAVSEDDDQVWSLELWTHHIGSVRSVTFEPDYAFDPANSMQVELTRRLDRFGQETGHEVEVEYKHVFNRLARDGWGWALSAAFGAQRSGGTTAALGAQRSSTGAANTAPSTTRATTVRLPVSVDLGQWTGSTGIAPLLHLNIGLHKASEARRVVTNAVALEQILFKRSLLFAEWAREGDQRVAQVGVRHWLQKEKLALDIAWQQHRAPGERATGWVAGIGWYDL